MAGGTWQKTATAVAGSAPSIAFTAPTTGNQAIRLRALLATIAGTANGSDTLTIYDGTSSGTVIFSTQMNMLANSTAYLPLTPIDLRAISGTMTIQFTSGVTSAVESLFANGDLVPVGKAYLDS